MSIYLFTYLNTIYLGFGLDSGTWHSVHVLRSGRHVVLEIDGVTQRTETLMSSTSVLKRSK